jgi:hypothetical protein
MGIFITLAPAIKAAYICTGKAGAGTRTESPGSHNSQAKVGYRFHSQNKSKILINPAF